MNVPDRTTVMVLREFLEGDPFAVRYGFELMRRLHLSSATLYPILARLQQMSWIEADQESPEPGDPRPARRTYRLTAPGAQAARHELAVIADRDFRSATRVLLPGLVGGHK